MKRIISWFSRHAPANKIFIAALVIVASVLMLSRWFFKNQEPQYQTAKAERGTIVAAVSASGQVIASNIVNINTQATGIIKEVFVKDGEKVAVGQKIAEITLDREGQQKNAAAWAAYLSAKNNLESANTTLYTLQSQMFSVNQKFINDAAARKLAETDPTYIQENADWLAAEAKYKNQESVINQAKANLTSAWLSYQATSPLVISPVEGLISNLGIIPGMILNSETTKVAVVRNEARPIVNVNLTEADVARVKVGQKATITFDSLPDKTFTGKVATVDKIGTTSNNVTAYSSLIQLESAPEEILPSMNANARIIIETKTDVLLVPSAAVQTQDGRAYVRVLKDSREEQRPVEVGLSDDTHLEIISGLTEGEEVITGTITAQTQTGRSVFSGSFGGGALRPGGFSR